MRAWLLAVTASALLTACAAWTLVGTERQRLAQRYTVAPQIAWSRLAQGDAELWTVDGPALQAIRFFDALGDGDALLPGPRDDKPPAFRAGMSATEVQELVVHSLQRAGAGRVTPSGLRPLRFGDLDGFRFDLDFLNDRGLEMKGLVAGALDGGKLYLILYSGTAAHYYPRYEQEVERVLASISTRL